MLDITQRFPDGQREVGTSPEYRICWDADFAQMYEEERYDNILRMLDKYHLVFDHRVDVNEIYTLVILQKQGYRKTISKKAMKELLRMAKDSATLNADNIKCSGIVFKTGRWERKSRVKRRRVKLINRYIPEDADLPF